jgi:alpha-tubulin suppressor-like RCC1 family protein
MMGGRGGAPSQSDGGASGDDAVGGEPAMGAGGVPDEYGMDWGEQGGPEVTCTMPGDANSACQNCGNPVTQPNSEAGCDCPSGTWDARCSLVSVDITMGSQKCVLKSDASVACWGFDYANPPPANLQAKSISAGTYHTCAVDLAGALHCWGQDADNIFDVPDGVFTLVRSSGGGSCALRENGLPECWGVTKAPPQEPLLAIDAIGCGVKPDHTVTCWGGDATWQPPQLSGKFVDIAFGGGQMCGITLDQTLRCTQPGDLGLPPEGKFTQIAMGTYHACGLRTDGSVRCWGQNDRGQALPPADHFRRIAAADNSTCGVRTDGSVTCWGELAEYDEAGAPSGVFMKVKQYQGNVCGLQPDGSLRCWGNGQRPPAGAFKDAAPGNDHGCGVRTDGTLACWGANDQGQASPPPGTFQQVDSGHFASCAISTDKAAVCWGTNEYHLQQPPNEPLLEVSVGQTHACAIRPNGSLVCWGEKGVGLTDAPLGNFQHVYAGIWHSCALRTDGTASCWGEADESLDHGQSAPPKNTHFTVLAVGLFHSCGLTAQGGVECWGDNLWGEGTSQVGPFIAITAGDGNTCGLHPNGRLECWGSDARPLQ